jgi:hypothetical protein
MAYSLDYAPVPLPPRRPNEFSGERQNLNAMMGLIADPKEAWRQRQEDMMRQYMLSIHPGSMLGIRSRMDQSVPMSDYAGGRDIDPEQGPPMTNNSLRDLIYQYMFAR